MRDRNDLATCPDPAAPSGRPDPRRRDALRAAACLALTLLPSVTACKGGGGRGGQGSASASGKRGGRESSPTYPVDVMTVSRQRIAYAVTAPGTLAAIERVQITARVAGGVDKVAFVEGQKVKKGDLLVAIDPARYRAAVSAASAAVERAKASQSEAETQAARREAMNEKSSGLVSTEEIATYKTKVLTAKADLGLASANLETAQVNLRDATVRAPVDGVIQTRTVDTGQYVQPGALLATLVFTDDLLVRFQVSPLEAPRLSPGMAATFRLRESPRDFEATVTLIASAADPDSRMVPVTAAVKRSDHTYFLRPGAFCDVTVAVGGAREVVVVPRAAVRPTERGFVAYVVDGEVVHERILTLGLNTADGWVEVRQGLEGGEKLVLRGTEPLSEGAKVKGSDVATPASSSFLASSASAAPAAPVSASPGGAASAGAPR